ncbi:MAG: putative membrane protein [Cenarchaeum symbiont of Oopsacas minuta]|nr:putative membrane protein [Cenarchaeum symbiont of Oopsacas minuta]
MIQNKTLWVAITVISLPIVFALVVYSDTFSLSWNQGRGGFLFALAFIVAELVGLHIGVKKSRIIAAVPLALLVIAYMVLLENGLREQIESIADYFGIQLLLSWVWMWDFIIMAIFTTTVLIIFFGTKWIRIAPAGPIFLCGSAIILSLDAFFPYDSLGPLQYFVPYLVELNVWLVDLFDLGVANASGNMMFLKGDHGPFALQVFWPSAGVHSIIIYSLVMMAFLLKMRIVPRRKLAWFALGIFGTILVNVIRIFSLSWYALKVTTDVTLWEEFHSIAGEIMFLPWLFTFLMIVAAVESKRLRRLDVQENQK